MPSVPWFERWPELAKWELQRFADRGLEAILDKEAKDRGQFVVRTKVRFRGKDLPIEALYPSETPELPSLVFGPPGLLGRHQNPFDGNFCLLERPLDDWPAHRWGAADLISERLTALLRDMESGPETVRAAEAPMAEPFSAYYKYVQGAVVLIPENLASPDTDRGSLTLQVLDRKGLRFVLAEVGVVTGTGPLLEQFQSSRVVKGKWFRLEHPPPHWDGPSMSAWIRNQHPGALRTPVPTKLAKSPNLKNRDVEMVGFVFPEEGPGVGQYRDAWAFLCLSLGGEPVLVRSEIVSIVERQRRAPHLAQLEDRSVVVVGLGTLGGEIAVELSKAGVGRLDLVDFDRHEAASSIRHVLGIESVGLPKTFAVARACHLMNPFSQSRPQEIYLGDVTWEQDSPLQRLEELLDGSDIVVDASGSHQIQALVARLASERNLPMISCWLTPGFLGGHVLRIIPVKTSCFICFAEDAERGERLRAEAGPETSVVVRGCSHPTTSGAGFDAGELAAIATRFICQTLLAGDGLADAPWDHAVVNFYRDATDPEFPTFASERLLPRKDCRRCLSAAGSSATP